MIKQDAQTDSALAPLPTNSGPADSNVPAASKLSIRLFEPSQAEDWKRFLFNSNNGTLFHDLDFLNYHTPGKFQTYNLMFFESERLLALLPAAIVTVGDDRRFLQSPYGASVGGLVLPPGLSVDTSLDLVACLKKFVTERGLHGLEMRIGPSVYSRQSNELLSFSLMVKGFQLVHRWSTFVIPIGFAGAKPVETLFSSRMMRYVRAHLRDGLCPREVGVDRLDDFYGILIENWDRHQARPTHDKEEIARIFQLVPGRTRLFLCAYEQTEIAGALVFILNDCVAYTMYLCQSDGHRELHSPAVSHSLRDRVPGKGRHQASGHGTERVRSASQFRCRLLQAKPRCASVLPRYLAMGARR